MFKFIKKLFCDHKWSMQSHYITRFDHIWNGMPNGSSWELIARLKCNKCGKILAIRQSDTNKYALLDYINSYLPLGHLLEFKDDNK
mgnify:CR=1 FL=1